MTSSERVSVAIACSKLLGVSLKLSLSERPGNRHILISALFHWMPLEELPHQLRCRDVGTHLSQDPFS